MKNFINSDLFAVMAMVVTVVLFITIAALILDGEPNRSSKPNTKTSIELYGTHAVTVIK